MFYRDYFAPQTPPTTLAKDIQRPLYAVYQKMQHFFDDSNRFGKYVYSTCTPCECIIEYLCIEATEYEPFCRWTNEQEKELLRYIISSFKLIIIVDTCTQYPGLKYMYLYRAFKSW